MAALPQRLKASLALVAVVALGAPPVVARPVAAVARPVAAVARPFQGRSDPPRRIVSLIPATTEMLFAMGASDRIAGVGAYDRYPPEVDRFPRVGGLLDPNVERILSLAPDLVLVYSTQADLIRQLERAGVPIFKYEHSNLADITRTMRAIGARVGVASAAERAAADVERRLAEIQARVAGRARPSTLLVFGREPGSLRGIDASGGYGFLHDVLEIAGGADVMGDVKRQSIQMSAEMILARAPQVIIELQYGDSPRRQQIDAETRVWNALASVPAVRNGRVHILPGDEFVVPGPRIAVAAERFARVLHPGAFK